MKRINTCFNYKKQKGATFVSWMAGAGLFIFLAITGIKIAPVYLQFNNVKIMVDELATDPATKSANKRIVRSALDKRLNINGIDDQLSGKNFNIERIKGSNNRKQITVNYEVRKPWVGNLDFVATFKYAKEIGIEQTQ